MRSMTSGEDAAMNQNVTIDVALLRPQLRRWFAVESDHASAAAGLCPDMERALAHHARAAAIAALLECIGGAPDGEAAVTIDALQHGWAAREALRALVLAEERIIDREGAAGEYEAAGEAMGRCHDARLAIAAIEEVADRLGGCVEPPSPAPTDDGAGGRSVSPC
jgi:hypothetical protein